MPAILRDGSTKIEYRPKKASTVFGNGALVSVTSGASTIEPGTSSSTTFVGVIAKVVAATDADYAATTMVPIIIPTAENVFEIDFTGGAAKIGARYDLSTSLVVDIAATTRKVVSCVGFVSASSATSGTHLFKITSTEAVMNGS